MEQEECRVEVAHEQQGYCTSWEGVVSRVVNWEDIWKLPQV